MIIPSTIKHVSTKRPKDFDKYFYYIPEVICNPIMVNIQIKRLHRISQKDLCREQQKGEFFCFKINTSKEILLSSFYSVNWVKVDSRRKRGRLIEYI